ncbi:DUF4351 domain-containing protein [Synechococcus sp. PCC 6312]|uniref:DUF4351 domain-containing protein n=1 Tax=Synechococcus sp. (strain ATCC 27167 / PCC 6312) TaxID=195253 RepID=UPI0002F06326|nr:DUF4351 domain-containing protein [Synechococcus sp. PCC 6312]
MLGFTTTELHKSRFYQEIKQEIRDEVLEEGRQEGEQLLILRQLSQGFGELDPGLVTQITALSLDRLEELGLAIFDFETGQDLQAWLQHD